MNWRSPRLKPAALNLCQHKPDSRLGGIGTGDVAVGLVYSTRQATRDMHGLVKGRTSLLTTADHLLSEGACRLADASGSKASHALQTMNTGLKGSEAGR